MYVSQTHSIVWIQLPTGVMLHVIALHRAPFISLHIYFEKLLVSLLFLTVPHKPSFSLPLHVPLSLTLCTVFSASYFAWFIVICVSAAAGLPLCICEGVVLFMAVCAINHFSLKMMGERRYAGTRKRFPGLPFRRADFWFENGPRTLRFRPLPSSLSPPSWLSPTIYDNGSATNMK